MSSRWGGRRAVGPGLALAALAALGADPEFVQLRNSAQPILVYNGSGHAAPVRSMLFVPGEGGPLLTAGLDRVVNVWDVPPGRPSLARTIRPPITREPRGSIHALALGPPGAGGERLLALGGISPTSAKVGLILLYRYPGAAGGAAGDPVAVVPPTDAPETLLLSAVRGDINALALNATGTLLASAGFDDRIVIWDVSDPKAPKVWRTLEGADALKKVNRLAFAPDASRLWSGGTDGYVRTWDLRKVAPPTLGPPIDAAPGALLKGKRVVSMAVDPGGRWLVAGREDGTLVRYDAATLANPVRVIPKGEELGPVDAVAFHPALPQVGLARIARRFATEADEPDTRCLVEIRSVEDGRAGTVIDRAPDVSDVVRACAFDDRGRVFAYSGGEAQSVYLKRLDGSKAVEELRGHGSTIREVGFAKDGPKVAFRRGPGPRPAGSPFESFGLVDRRPGSVAEADVHPVRSKAPLGEYRLTPTLHDAIRLTGPDVDRVLRLDERYQGRWYSYCLVPHPAGGPPAVAVGCEHVILLFTPRADAAGRVSYAPARSFRGHSGPVHGLGVSADGRRLASGGSDQTVRIWALRPKTDGAAPAGWERAALGAGFEARPDGKVALKGVEPDGFAKVARLREGDVVVRATIAGDERAGRKEADYGPGRPLPLARFFEDGRQVPPGTPLQVFVERGGVTYGVQTSLQDDPVASLFVTEERGAGRGEGIGREWVLWNPDGYYDTTATADRRFLGWHRNASNARRTAADLYKPTSFFPSRTFQDLLRNPKVLDDLLAGRTRSQALPKDAGGEILDVVPLIEAAAPPTLRVVEPIGTESGPVRSERPTVPLRVAMSGGRPALAPAADARPVSPLKSLVVLLDGRQVAEVAVPPERDADGAATVGTEIPMTRRGRRTVTLVATNEAGRGLESSFVVDHQPPEPPPAPPREPILKVVAIGVPPGDGGALLPALKTAGADVRGVVGDLFTERVQRYHEGFPKKLPPPAEPIVVEGKGATGSEIQRAFAALGGGGSAPLGEGDTAVVVVSGYVLGRGYVEGQGNTAPRLVAADSRGDPFSADGGLDTQAITDALGTLVKSGCRVVAIIDGFHAEDPRQGVGVREWSHRLDERGVIVCLTGHNRPTPIEPTRPGRNRRSPAFEALVSLGDGKWTVADRDDQRLTLALFGPEYAARMRSVDERMDAPLVTMPATLKGQGDLPLFDPPPPPKALAKARE